MAESVMYHEGNRKLQDQFDSRRISDRLEEKLMRTEFTDDDKTVYRKPADTSSSRRRRRRPAGLLVQGRPPGFVRVTGPSELAFPDYDGNGMFKSLGNIVVNPEVGLLFIAMGDKPQRLRVNGSGSGHRRRPADRGDRRRAAASSASRRARSSRTARATSRPWDRSSRRSTRPRRAGRAGRAGMEGLCGLQGLHPPAAADFQGLDANQA